MDAKIIPPELVIEICGHIRIGVTFEVAALAVGLSVDQITEIVPVLRDAESGYYKDLSDNIKKAMAQFEIMQLMKINAEGGASGAKWLLERTMPEKWGPVEKPKTPRKERIEETKKLEINITDFRIE